MDKQEIKSIIKEYQEFVVNVTLIQRPVKLESKANYAFVGMRRSGKSHILYQIIQSELKSGNSVENILFLNFEDERFVGATSKDLTLILECYKEMYDRQPIVFLDEIQVIADWQKFARRLADTKYRVFVTGSNAEMLSSEIATTLGGRFIIHEVYPYSFEEYLSAQNISLDVNWEFSNLKNKIVQFSQTYLQYGGLPEILTIENKRPWLSGLYQKIFFGDVLARFNIRNDFALKLMIKKLAESVMHPISYNRLANIVSSAGSKTGVSTMMEYLKYVQSSWLIFSVPNYASALQEKETTKKYYFTDNGILSLFLTEGHSILLENIVAITLWRHFGEQLYYYNKNVEVDFYMPETKTAIQVCYDISDINTLEREINALVRLGKRFPVEKAVIITNNEEKTLQQNNLSVEIVPIWKWLIKVAK